MFPLKKSGVTKMREWDYLLVMIMYDHLGLADADFSGVSDRAQFVLNCTTTMVQAALAVCSLTNSSLDGISFKLLKYISQYIIYPLNVIFQCTIFEGVFPTVWKLAVVIPLYKRRGDRGMPCSYCPMSLCSCFGQLLERIVYMQLSDFLGNDMLYSAQHSFTHKRSTFTY